ncbi:MAG: hypothetical protein PWQ31_917 [Eubacteriales bacterium]|nr:hypothetical protein [Eubacteriales bacterium]
MAALDIEKLAREVERELWPLYREIEERMQENQRRVLAAFRNQRVREYHFAGSTGYGYGDAGRAVLEAVYAEVFGAEGALVRPSIVSGTHAIFAVLKALLKPGQELLAITGAPYDTLQKAIGIKGAETGTLREKGIGYRQVELLPDGQIDLEGISRALRPQTGLVLIQRSRGYDLRPSLTVAQIKKAVAHIRSLRPDVPIFVDNCYGEFVEEMEPTHVGADLIAGSLIKNPGGGLAPGGGYVAGKKKYLDLVAAELAAPGIGWEVGATYGLTRSYFQGLFLAPHVVAQALQGALFAAALFSRLGYEVYPGIHDVRGDIIQAVVLGSPEKMLAFCRGLQSMSPVDSDVVPEAALLPGYEDPVVMAGGTFIQGSSIELSADGPLRPPYAVYFQGGLSRGYTVLALIAAAREVGPRQE